MALLYRFVMNISKNTGIQNLPSTTMRRHATPQGECTLWPPDKPYPAAVLNRDAGEGMPKVKRGSYSLAKEAPWNPKEKKSVFELEQAGYVDISGAATIRKWIWPHYHVNDEKGLAVCKHCQRRFKMVSSMCIFTVAICFNQHSALLTY